MKVLRLLLINSIAVWSVVAATVDLGLGFDWWVLTMSQVTLLHAFYIALVMMFRQFFSLAGDDVQHQSDGVTHASDSTESMTAGVIP